MSSDPAADPPSGPSQPLTWPVICSAGVLVGGLVAYLFWGGVLGGLALFVALACFCALAVALVFKVAAAQDLGEAAGNLKTVGVAVQERGGSAFVAGVGPILNAARKAAAAWTTARRRAAEKRAIVAAMEAAKPPEPPKAAPKKQPTPPKPKPVARPQQIRTKIVGVSHRNPDGSDRQKLITRHVRPGCRLQLRHEPRNPVDKNALAVDVVRPGLLGGRKIQIGYLRAELAAEILGMIRAGKTPLVSLLEVTGGGSHEHVGVNILIEVA